MPFSGRHHDKPLPSPNPPLAWTLYNILLDQTEFEFHKPRLW